MKTKYKNIVSSLFMVATISLLMATGCNNTSEEVVSTNESTPINEEVMVEFSADQYNVAEIALGSVEQKTLSSVLKVNGTLDVPPQNLMSVSAPMGGFVFSTELLPGMRVKKGELLAVLEHPDYVQLQQDYVDKKSQLKYLVNEYSRQKELHKENVSSEKVFQQTQSEYTSMQAQIKGLEEKLKMIGVNVDLLTEKTISRKVNIHSSISGYVSEVNVNIGKYVSPNEVMFEIVNTEHLHVELTVYEKDVVKLKEGLPIRFTLPNEDNKERKASIHLIGRKIDKDRSVKVHAHLEEEDTELLPGMYVNAFIELNENKVTAIPESAIVMSEGGYFVYALKEKLTDKYLFEMMEIKKGVTENGYSEISFIDNVNTDNLQLVTNGAFALLSKMKNTEEE